MILQEIAKKGYFMEWSKFLRRLTNLHQLNKRHCTRKTQNDGGNFQRRFSNKFKMTLEIHQRRFLDKLKMTMEISNVVSQTNSKWRWKFLTSVLVQTQNDGGNFQRHSYCRHKMTVEISNVIFSAGTKWRWKFPSFLAQT